MTSLTDQQKAAREAFRQQVDQPVDFDFSFLDEIVAQAFHAGAEEERRAILEALPQEPLVLENPNKLVEVVNAQNEGIALMRSAIIKAITARGEKEELMDYERNYSHDHCWKQDGEPACGQPLEKHKQCCLCDTPHTNV